MAVKLNIHHSMLLRDIEDTSAIAIIKLKKQMDACQNTGSIHVFRRDNMWKMVHINTLACISLGFIVIKVCR